MSYRKDIYGAVVRPLVTEKGTHHSQTLNAYAFEVAPDANKTQIKIAVEKIFGVKVSSVTTLNRQGKRKRTRFGYGKRKDTKRAIVTLAEGSKSIEIFGGPVS